MLSESRPQGVCPVPIRQTRVTLSSSKFRSIRASSPPSFLPQAVAAMLSKKGLPSKETTLFKELLSQYENRQLKKGLKIADQILKKFPNHGGMWRVVCRSNLFANDRLQETLCMKGLILTHMGERDAGLDLVKMGMKLDLTSHICWHVFGLIQKGEKNYEGALKSYQQALRYDKVRCLRSR